MRNDTEDILLGKLQNYCAYRERCISEMIVKMDELGIPAARHEGYLRLLEEENFLNEERYAGLFVVGHLRKKWGREKIRNALLSRGLHEGVIQRALEKEIDQPEYRRHLEDLLEKQLVAYQRKGRLGLRRRLFSFARGKGYETGLINNVLDGILGTGS